MADNDVYKVTLAFSNSDSGKQYFPGFYIQQQGAVGFDVTDVGAEVKDWWNVDGAAGPKQRSWHAANYQLDSVRLRKWDPLEPVETSYSAGLPIAGSAAGASYAPNNAILLSLRTDFIGRSYRNRVYLPTPAEASAQNGLLTSADALDISDRFVELIGALTAIGAGGLANAVVVAYSAKLAIATPVTHTFVDENLRSQRRRTPRTPVYQGT